MTTVAFHPPFVKTSYVKVIMLRKALFPTPGKRGFTFTSIAFGDGNCLGAGLR